MDTISISISKKKLILSFLGSMIFVIGAISFLVIEHSTTSIIVAILFIQFFGFYAIYVLFKTLDKKTGLLVNEEGITDNSSYIGSGLIRWENITALSVTKINSQKMLSISVNNAQEIIERQKGFSKFLLKLNNNIFQSQIHISSNSLKCNFDELCRTIITRFEGHRQKL